MKKTFYLSLLFACASFGCGWASTEIKDKDSEISFDKERRSAPESLFISQFSNAQDLNVDSVPVLLSFADKEEALSYMKESGYWENYKAGILPKMLDNNLDYATKLLNNSHDGFIVVDKGRMKLVRFNKYGEPVATYGIACGKNYGTKHKRSDCRTPEGFFSVKKIQDSTDWKYVDDDGNVSQKTGEYGPRFIRLDIPGISSIGIHGTCAPWSIGGRRSHGCIRLKNENLMELVDKIEVGMPVIVSPGTKDQKINREEGVVVPRISTLVDATAASGTLAQM